MTVTMTTRQNTAKSPKLLFVWGLTIALVLCIGYLIPQISFDDGVDAAYAKYGEEGELFAKDARLQAQIHFDDPLTALLAFRWKVVSVERVADKKPCDSMKYVSSNRYELVTLENTYRGEVAAYTFFNIPFEKARVACGKGIRTIF